MGSCHQTPFASVLTFVLGLVSDRAIGQEVIVTLASGRELTTANAISEVFTAGPGYFIVYTGGPTTEAELGLLESRCVIEGYLWPFSYVVHADPKDLVFLRETEAILQVWPYNSSGLAERSLVESREPQSAEVHFFGSADVNHMAVELRSLRIPVVAWHQRSATVVATGEQARALTEVQGVEVIERTDEYEIVNDSTTRYVHLDDVRERFGLFGEGQIVAIADTGLDIGEISDQMHHDFWMPQADGSFSSRVLSITDYAALVTNLSTSPDDRQGHGTHVSGTVLGSGYISGSDVDHDVYAGSFAGMAPRAQLIFGAFGIDDPNSLSIFISGSGDIYYVYDFFYPDGAKVMSNSWSCTAASCPTSPYKKSAASTDQYIKDHPDLTVVYAAGNFYDHNTVKPPGNAKNTICVGAADGNCCVASFSSKGPTNDGRVKPDLVAPGVSLISTRSQVSSGACSWTYYGNPNYSTCSGTSMATPTTSGLVTIIREYYERYLQHAPSAALVKATLLNGCVALGYPIPSFDAGFGFANIENSLPEERKGLWFHEGRPITTGQRFVTLLDVEPGVPFSATLAWTDYPGDVESSRELVSDLNLIVTDPTGVVYNGNDSTLPFNDQIDNTNNVERVLIAVPLPGVYRLEVFASNTPLGPQDFALAYTCARMLMPSIRSVK